MTLETLPWNTRIVCSLQNFKIVFSLILGWFSVLRLSNKYLMLTVSFFVYVLRLKANNNNPMIVKNALNSLNSLTSDLNSMKECKIANDDLYFCLVHTLELFVVTDCKILSMSTPIIKSCLVLYIVPIHMLGGVN